MNLDAIFDDLASEYQRLSHSAPLLTDFTVLGYRTVTFGRDHFAGIKEGDDAVCLVRYRDPLEISLGRSRVEEVTLRHRLVPLVGKWLEVTTVTAGFAGRLQAFQSNLLIFRTTLVPLESVTAIRLKPVEN